MDSPAVLFDDDFAGQGLHASRVDPACADRAADRADQGNAFAQTGLAIVLFN
jgi:hypothetical protein